MIIAGGTGGHIMPGLALAEVLLEKGREVIFVAGNRPIEKMILRDTPFRVFHLPAEGIVGRALIRKIIALGKLLVAFGQSLILLRRINPSIVFAEGSYVAVPVVLAAYILRKKIGLHEQNLIPGKANLLLARFADRIFLSFLGSKNYFPPGKTLVCGNFVRKSLWQEYPREHEGLGLLILGGSLGARFINDLAVALLPQLLKEYPQLYVIWQTGVDDFDRMQKKSKDLFLGERVKIFPFIERMGWAYRQADFVISRAGASTLAELCALGIPALLIPFPYATHQHQEKNAQALSLAGGAVMLKQEEATPDRVLNVLREIFRHEEKRKQMALAMKRFYYPQAEARVISEMESLVRS